MKPDAPMQGTTVPLPPSARSRAAGRLTAAAAVGRFELQVCLNCGAVQYPPREACHRCLSSALEWRLQAGGAELLSETTLRHSHDEYFRARLPVRLGLVKLDVGPAAVVYLGDGIGMPHCRVRVEARLDKSGQGVLVASSDRLQVVNGQQVRSAYLREMSCDPRGRRVLVADAGSALGVALVRSLVDAGADVVWAGCSPAVAGRGGLSDLLGGFEQVRFVSLDATSDVSANALAGQIGSQVDVLIAAPDTNRPALVRLAQAFGPPMRTTAATTPVGSQLLAWVNLFDIDTPLFSVQSTSGASQPSAVTFAQSLRAEMRPAGVRVLNAFVGPLGDGGDRDRPVPKLAPAALARSVIKALQDGIEDLYPGELPQDWVARWCNTGS